MRRFFIITAVLAMACPVAASAITGLSIGGKVGIANYSGDILPSSGDVGTSVVYGAVLEITTFPIVDFELHANYFAKDFVYTYDVGGIPVNTEFEFRDFHLMALAKKNLISIPASPLGLYVGAGVGWHLINTEVAKNAVTDPSLADNPFTLFKNNAKMSGHGLLGVKVSPPVFPLAIYGEARFGRIFTDDALNTTQVEGGLMLKF